MRSFKIFFEAQELADIPRKPSAHDDHWGYHLLMDMSGCNHNIDDAGKVKAFLKELVEKLKMTPMGEPIIKKVDNEQGRR